MSRNLSQAVAETALEAGEAAVHSTVTIAARLPILAKHMTSPTADGLAEWHQASTEKVLALWEGTVAAVTGWNELVWRSLFSPMTPTGAAHEALVLVRAVSRPGHAAVRANAARLRGE
jgi:hypothetical protein